MFHDTKQPKLASQLRRFAIDKLRAIIDTGRTADKPVMCHAYGGECVKAAMGSAAGALADR